MAETADRENRAATIIQRYSVGAAALGALPLPLVDLAAIVGVQIKMVHSLARLYEVAFSRERTRSIIASLVGGSASVATGSLVKIIPFVGPAIGTVTVPIFAGASTYAIGKTFVQHFESGGTFLTLDPQKVRDYYSQELEKGQEEVKKSYVGIKP